MLRLRPYKTNDYKYMVKWVRSEREYFKWCADKMKYPLTKEVFNKYKKVCEADKNSWIFTAVDEQGKPVGQFLFNRVDYEKESAHISFVIINPELRGKGFGKEMMSLAIKYAFEVLNFTRLTLNVYDNNPAARSCYKAVGFKEIRHIDEVTKFRGEEWGLYEMYIEKEF